MRRDEREITSIDEIYDILTRCDVIRLSMNDSPYPYCIPMTFGVEKKEDKIIIYLHSAKEGKKWELLDKDNHVCIEADLYYHTVKEGDSITAKYESVIGFGKVEKLDEQQDKVAAFKVMLAHYKEKGFPVTSCKGLEPSQVFKVELDEVTGKHNI